MLADTLRWQTSDDMFRNIIYSIYKLTFRRGALIRAAMYGATDSIEFYIRQGVDPNYANRGGFTALFYAAHYGHIEILNLLLKAGARPDYANGRGITPLASAALNGHEEIVDFLLQAGADPNFVFPIGGTALCAAAKNNRIEIMSKLISAGADVNGASPELLITPLMGVAGHGHLKAVNLLLAAGANPLLTASSGDTARSLAALHDFHEVVQVLKDAELKHEDGHTSATERQVSESAVMRVHASSTPKEGSSAVEFYADGKVRLRGGSADGGVVPPMFMLAVFAVRTWGGEKEIHIMEEWVGLPKEHWKEEHYRQLAAGYLHWLVAQRKLGMALPPAFSRMGEMLEPSEFPSLEIPLSDDIASVYKAFTGIH